MYNVLNIVCVYHMVIKQLFLINFLNFMRLFDSWSSICLIHIKPGDINEMSEISSLTLLYSHIL